MMKMKKQFTSTKSVLFLFVLGLNYRVLSLKDEVLKDDELKDEVLKDEVLKDRVLKDGGSKDDILKEKILKYEVRSQHNWQSPCPRMFVYENVKEKGKWSGIFKLQYPKSVGGIWLKLEFDEPILKLETAFGEKVLQESQSEFVILAPNTPLQAHTPLQVYFTIEYDEHRDPPKFIGAELNTIKVCSGRNDKPQTTLSTNVAYGAIVERELTDDKVLPLGAFENIKEQEPTELEKQCGTVVMHATPLITYGESTTPGEFPWYAALYNARTEKYMCGGSLISDHYVVTAAHCVAKKEADVRANPKYFYVYLGKYYYSLFKPTSGIQSSRVSEVIVHPEYHHSDYKNDIALLKLAEPAVLTDFVRPVCLWDGDDDLVFVENQIGTICGWGYDEILRNDGDLKQAKLLVVSEKECKSSSPVLGGHLGPKSYCAGFKNGNTACKGDSGGGMVFPMYGPENRWVLRGVISVGAVDKVSAVCDWDDYIILTDAAKFSPWIKRIIKASYLS